MEPSSQERANRSPLGRRQNPPSNPLQSEQFLARPDVESLFGAFVERSNAIALHLRTTRNASKEELLSEDRQAERAEAPPSPHRNAVSSLRALELSASDIIIESAPDADELVPDVLAVRRALPAPSQGLGREGQENGQIPARELERFIGDMQVLLRYRHYADVTERLEELHARYPRDLLLLRRITEFHLEADNTEQAIQCLFKLASLLFERQHLAGMRVALGQILVLDADNTRATKLLSLLRERDAH